MADTSNPQEIIALLNQGRSKAALKLARAGMRRFPKEGGFANLAGLAAHQIGDKRAALGHFQTALRLAPTDPGFQNNVVQALLETGQLDRAETLIRQCLNKRPDRETLLYQLAALELQRGNPERAVDAASRAIDASEATANGGLRRDQTLALARSYNIRGVARLASAREDLALADYRKSLELNPDNPETLSNISLLLSMRMRAGEALAALERALALNPRHVNALQRYGIQLNEAGRLAEAIDAYHRLLDVAPMHADGMRELARLQDAAANAALRPKMQAVMAKLPKTSLDRVRLGFGLAHIAEQAGDATLAERGYAQANALAAGLRPHDQAEAAREEAAILAAFPAGYVLRDGPAAQTLAPVFVLGQPRSGTTLVEQVLSAHPGIVGAGELAMAARLARSFFDRGGAFDAAAARAFAEGYRGGVPQVLSEMQPAPRAFVDKMPANYKLIGFLATAFPDATILHVCRDPRDVAWSMWRSWFPNAPMNHTFDQAAMAAEANAYVRCMTHWKRLFPTRIHDIAYEDMVGDIDATSRRLAELCGVDWTADMAAPERNAASVRTASVKQVRQGVHRRSIGGWRRHAGALRVFLDRLDPMLWPDLAP